jgi:hypothetical protein
MLQLIFAKEPRAQIDQKGFLACASFLQTTTTKSLRIQPIMAKLSLAPCNNQPTIPRH